MTDKCMQPEDIKVIFSKPGVSWSNDDRYHVRIWLSEPPQRRKILERGARKLGNNSTPEDAEDAWQDFNIHYSAKRQCKWESSLEGVMRKYDPNSKKGRPFCVYLLFSFGRFCIRQKQSRSRPNSDFPIDNIMDNSDNPAQALEKKEQRQKLMREIDKLPEDQRDVIIMHCFEGLSLEEIALKLGVKKNTGKMRLYRAKQTIKKLLSS